MICRLLSLCAVMSLLSLSPAFGATTARGFDAMILLDPDQPGEARATELQLLKAAADRGEHPARCLLGRIGLHRQLAPSTGVEGEYGDPTAYLNGCVLGGDLDAMLVLAEVELRANKPLEAMIWVQAYLKLASYFGKNVVNGAAPYKAGLIARIEHAYFGKRPDNNEIQEYVAGLLAQHGKRIVSNCEKGGCAWLAAILPPQPEVELKSTGSSTSMAGRFTRDSTAARDELTYATFLLAIDESGRTARVLTIEAYPSPRAARDLVSHPRTRRFNKVAAGTGLRHTAMPVYIDNKAFDLMPDAAANRRPSQ